MTVLPPAVHGGLDGCLYSNHCQHILFRRDECPSTCRARWLGDLPATQQKCKKRRQGEELCTLLSQIALIFVGRDYLYPISHTLDVQTSICIWCKKRRQGEELCTLLSQIALIFVGRDYLYPISHTLDVQSSICTWYCWCDTLWSEVKGCCVRVASPANHTCYLGHDEGAPPGDALRWRV